MFGFGSKERTRPLVLHIDDQEASFVMAMSALSSLGCDIEHAPGGEAGIAMALKLQPDAILLDYSMPEMDGPDTCVKLKANPKTRDIPVIMVTAIDTVKDVERAMDSGACAYVVKPIVADRLWPKLEPLLKKKA